MSHIETQRAGRGFTVVLGSLFAPPPGQPNGHPVFTEPSADAELEVGELIGALRQDRTAAERIARFEQWAADRQLSLAMLLQLEEGAAEPISLMANQLLIRAMFMSEQWSDKVVVADCQPEDPTEFVGSGGIW